MRAWFVFLGKSELWMWKREIKLFAFIYICNRICCSKLWEHCSQSVHFKDLVQHSVPLKVCYEWQFRSNTYEEALWWPLRRQSSFHLAQGPCAWKPATQAPSSHDAGLGTASCFEISFCSAASCSLFLFVLLPFLFLFCVWFGQHGAKCYSYFNREA